MAGMKFTADVNVKDIIKLRQEIDRLTLCKEEKQMKHADGHRGQVPFHLHSSTEFQDISGSSIQEEWQ